MQLLFLSGLDSGKHLSALCWTLAHSLWQGAVLAVLAGVMVSITRRAAAALRYNMLLALFFCFIVSAVFTYCWHLGQFSAPSESPSSLLPASISAVPLTEDTPSSAYEVFFEGLSFMLNTHASTIVFVWLAICFIRLSKLVSSLRYLGSLRHEQTTAPHGVWKATVVRLANDLGITRRIAIMESGLAEVPQVIGHFKPMILLPAGMLCSLPPAEIEAILLHELAHIRRRDYLVNILQHGVELLFFFNPPLMWISSKIRSERENCCDDIAAGLSDDRRTYINALVTFYEKQLSIPGAVAWTGTRHQMFDRVKRLLYNRNKNLNIMEKLLLSVGIVAAGFCLYAFDIATPAITAPGKMSWSAVSFTETPVADTIGKGKYEINGVADDGRKYRILMENEQVKELYVDGVLIALQEMTSHQTTVNKMIRQHHQALEQEKLQQQQSAQQRDQQREQEKQQQSEKQRGQAGADREKRDKSQKDAIKSAEKASARINEDIEKALKDAERNMQKSLKEIRESTLSEQEINEALAAAKEAHRDALKEIAEIDREEIKRALDDARRAMKDVSEIDHKEIQEAMAEAKEAHRQALKDVSEIDHSKIQKDIDDAMAEYREALEEIKISASVEKEIREAVKEAVEASKLVLKEIQLSAADQQEIQKAMDEVQQGLKEAQRELENEASREQEKAGVQEERKKGRRSERPARKRNAD